MIRPLAAKTIVKGLIAALTLVLVPTISYAASEKRYEFSNRAPMISGNYARIPANSDNDFSMSAETAGYVITDVYTCPGATYDYRLRRNRSFQPDVTVDSLYGRSFCAGQSQNLSADWDSGRFHWDLGIRGNTNGSGFLYTMWG